MDEETIATFSTVCTAGHAYEGFNGKTNEQLQHLADVGLLVVAYAPKYLSTHPAYTPTHKGWELFKRLLHGGNPQAESSGST